jgi:hypothetical protein
LKKERKMKTSKIITAAALSLLAAAGAHAETYEGVQAPVSTYSRAEVNAQATEAARAANPYAEGAPAGVAPVVASVRDRSAVEAEAVAAAHDGTQSLDRKAFVNSVIPAQYKIQRTNTRQAGL